MSARVLLVGLPGAGKSTTGRRLARILCVPFADSDDLVEAAQGRTVQEIFAADGEAVFRAAECAAVTDALTGDFDGVLSLGGGAVLDPDTQAALTGRPVVFLRVGLADASRRVGLGQGRPLLLGNVRSRIKTLLEERAPVYESVATLVVDTDGRPPAEIAAEIATRLEERA